MTDLTYTQSGIFTCFIPQTESGETAWRTIAEQTDGTGKVFNTQAQNTITQLRRAGYSVAKSKPVTKKEMSNLYAELDELFA